MFLAILDDYTHWDEPVKEMLKRGLLIIKTLQMVTINDTWSRNLQSMTC